jgi:hypothetical protein
MIMAMTCVFCNPIGLSDRILHVLPIPIGVESAIFPGVFGIQRPHLRMNLSGI